MDIKIGMDVICKIDGNKGRIVNIVDNRVELIDDGDYISWFMDIRVVKAWFNPVEE